ncbi:alpha-ketoglutarate-dependent dioxygenase AlkB [Flammeovirga sp. EKP202]|uniref:alpha-ketoglutarate-dependent dioxygenase AlkB family protein n=1 Tax=Flammeovirga sp. EKP202 TaxID=2770592 RepID=UPI00165FE7DE|nr:alpha-ketoglutarate-dependent dioxygenase AlkB [Flammeovirga sp. EKP202]MBD0401811.1 alpha-ketoglutarate-dependent dioxygenase AlkB [Flammeovirga sp. EKP202]
MLSLFDQTSNQSQNLLPFEGDAFYYGKVFSFAEATSLYQNLFSTIDWQSDLIKMFGKEILTKRKMAWYGLEPYEYTYSKVKKTALLFNDTLLQLLKVVEEKTGETYNSCLLNLYHDGNEGMGYHSDNEKEMKEYGAIASLSLGAERKFSFKHRETKEKVNLLLEHGSLLVMKGETQKHWVHALPVSKRVLKPRINLTFRTVVL